ncbi:hypothetical protein NESM_000137300 [Novymonas esmeraldas]|uniref:C2CD3 N-terminal C2 domain-containing protein n=1 Tax=Novymonas esmeraldas TaxID=1808958 RepID=A0AAW0F3R3_9TRYP
MRVLYGTPLPPGLVAPTRGELRLRVDQLILDDDAINHNPLVQFSDATDAAGTAVSGAEPNLGRVSRSPNRFVVPVDYCAVGPIFWGETRPSAHGQPSTPQMRRDPVTIAYPIKMEQAQFAAYLARMTASPQRGVQVDVFVPSSYSGRPPVTVGRCRIALDTLLPGHPVQGWFTVVHRRARLSAEDAGPYRFAEVPIGKVKLTATMETYLSSRRRSEEPKAAAAAAAASGAAKHKRHLEGKDTGRVPLPRAKTSRSHRHPGRTETSSTSAAESQASSSPSRAAAAAPPAEADAAQRRPPGHRGAALLRDRSATTQQLLQQGLQLRAQMEAAARGLNFDDPDTSLSVGAAEDRRGGHGRVSFHLDDDDGGLGSADREADESSDVAYTSEDSDEEKFALQMQKDAEARERRGAHQQRQQQQQQQQQEREQGRRAHVAPAQDHASIASATAAEGEGGHAVARGLADGATPEDAGAGATSTTAGHSRQGARAAVELCFSNFSFAQTALTADLHEIRIGVRLSSDITTVEPSSGPLSSFVHPVPLQQPSICLHFDVCSFSEERSKLVVEAYKVTGELEEENGGDDGWGAAGPRHVAREELLGLSVVGLYRQSRAVVFRDPVQNQTNAFAHLDVRVWDGGARGGARTGAAALDTTSHEGQDGPNNFTGAARGTLLPAASTPPRSTAPVGYTTTPAATAAAAPAQPVKGQTTVASATQTPPAERGGASDYPVRYSPTLFNTSATSTVTERRRLRVVVYNATELPCVAVAGGRRHGGSAGGGEHFPVLSARPRSIPEVGVSGAASYAEPNSFVTIEEVYRVGETWRVDTGTAAAAAPAAAAATITATSPTGREAIQDWYVDEARGGFYDRSAVADECSNPVYNYEAVLQLPELVVSVDDGSTTATGAGATPARPKHGIADVLDELLLSVWHSDRSSRASALGRSAGSGTPHRSRESAARLPQEKKQQEEEFWGCAAYMGTCRVDLRPLRYLTSLDGYYRVVCERVPGSGVGPTRAEVESSTIGYLRLSVSVR